MQVSWNPWHGCRKISAGCANCYVVRLDKRFGRDPHKFVVTQALELPIARKRDGSYRYPAGTKFMTCFTSDFLLEDADKVRQVAWNCMRERKDCRFFFVTKRIDRLLECLPDFWHEIDDNVDICCTCENQDMADYRLPIFENMPCKHKFVIVEPMLEYVNVFQWMSDIEGIAAGGESGYGIRQLDIKWIRQIAEDCKAHNVPFWFKQTGARFINDEGQLVTVARHRQYELADSYDLSTANWMYDGLPVQIDNEDIELPLHS